MLDTLLIIFGFVFVFVIGFSFGYYCPRMEISDKSNMEKTKKLSRWENWYVKQVNRDIR